MNRVDSVTEEPKTVEMVARLKADVVAGEVMAETTKDVPEGTTMILVLETVLEIPGSQPISQIRIVDVADLPIQKHSALQGLAVGLRPSPAQLETSPNLIILISIMMVDPINGRPVAGQIA